MSGERMFGPFVFILSFIGITVLLILQIPYTLVANQNYKMQDQPTGYEVIGGVPFVTWDPGNVSVTNTTIFDYAPEMTRFSPPTPTAAFYRSVEAGGSGLPSQSYKNYLRVYVVRNNTNDHPGWKSHGFNDLLWFYENQGGFWGSKHRYAAIPFAAFLEDYDNETNSASTSFIIGDQNFTVSISAAGFLPGYLYWNDFNITIKQTMGEAIRITSQRSLWTLLGQVLTGQLPNVHWFINALMLATFWPAIGFISFTLISRVIPFIGD